MFQGITAALHIKHRLTPPVSLPAPMLPLIGATHVLYPDPAPGRIPAHAAAGAAIGYVAPLTPGIPHLVQA